MANASGIEVVKRYLGLVETLTSDTMAFDALLHPSFTCQELPNAIAPRGQVRDLAACLQGLTKARQLLSSQTYTIKKYVDVGDSVVVELKWEGSVSRAAGPFQAGQKLTAHCCMIFELRDGRIASQRTYDCYEPFSA